jgi:lysozyme
MKPRHQVSKAAIELIKSFEGYRRSSAVLSNGRYTIGYGHTKSARADVEIPERDAEALLIYDLLEVTSAVNDLTFTPLTQNQFDALVCFAFNIGLDNFRRSSVLRRVNEGNLLQAAAALEAWRRSEFEGERIVVDALVRRRAAEKALFLTPTDGWIPAPTPVLPPNVDYEVASNLQPEDAIRLIAPLEGPVAVAYPEGPAAASKRDAEEVTSPVTMAADAVTARLRALEPAETESQPAAGQEPVTGPEPEGGALVNFTDEAPEAHFTLTASDGQDAPYELTEEPEPQISPEPESASLPFEDPADAPTSTEPLEAEAPLTLGAGSHVHRIGRREPTAYIADDTFPRFHESAEPMRFHLLPLVGLFLGGLALVAFAVVWGANTNGAGASAGPVAVSWVSGVIGIAAMVAAFYLFVTRLGGTED